MSKRLFATALLAVVVAACGGDGRITEPRAAEKPRVLNAIGTDPRTGATIETSQDDYAPGEKVHVTGRGWAPSETVTLLMTEDPDTHEDVSMEVQADSAGAFSVHFYDVQEYDLGVLFTLTATGKSSGSVATATFTDGTISGATIEMRDGATCASAQGSVVAGNPICAFASFTIGGGGATAAQFRWKSPAGAIVQISQRSPDFPNGTSGTNTFGASYAPTTAGTWTVLLCQSSNTDPAPGGTAQCSSSSQKASQTFVVTAAPSNTPPNVSAGGPYTGNEGSAISITGTATDGDGTVASTTWSVASTVPAGVNCSFADASALSTTVTCDDNATTVTLTLTATDDDGATNSANATVTVSNVDPSATFSAPSPVNEGSSISLSLTSPTDPSSADVAEGLTYAFDCGSGYGPLGAGSTASCPTTDDGSRLVKGKIQDKDGGFTEYSASVTIANVAPTATFNAPTPVDEGSPINLSLTNPFDPSADDVAAGFEYAFDCGDGLGYGSYGSTASTSCPTSDNGTRTVRGKIKDKDGGESSYQATVTVNNVAPTLTSIIGSAAPVAVNTSTSVTFAFSDPAGTNDTYTASVDWGDGNPSSGTVTPGGSLSHTYTAAGVYTVCATVSDEDGGTSAQKCYMYIVVYDPSAGFVTGGGWINSPLGAYVASPSLTGKATFGFVSKYKKGANVPDGNTEFQFHAGNMNFKSTVYEWLVVSGARGQFKGSGTINGSGNYGFMLTAIDGQIAGGGGTDKFRIKIWDKNNGDAVVYDNQMGATDTDAITTALGGGSINIQAK